MEEYWIVSPQGAVEIYYLEDGRYVLEENYMLQADKEDEDYNAEQEITLKAFPNIKMMLGEIFEGGRIHDKRTNVFHNQTHTFDEFL